MRPTVSLLWLSLLTACVPGPVIRHLPLYVPNQAFNQPPGSIPNFPDTKIAYIELDDMGDLWNSTQIIVAEKMIRDANNIGKATKTGAIVLTYVHGWHQNADPTKVDDTSNLVDFKRILGWTAYDEIVEARSIGRSIRPVVGVYFGWRGITGYWPFDYYNRDKAAGRVAGAAATAALLRITTVARENLQTRSIVIGHSMGAMIVEHSLLPVLDAYMLKLKGESTQSQCQVRDLRQYLPADLIVLINSAAHAIEAEKFIETLQELRVELKQPLLANPKCKFFDDNKPWSLPLLISLTSEGDSSTRVILNLAAYPMTIAKSFRDYPKIYRGTLLTQRDLLLHSPGNFEPLASHWVRHEKLETPGPIAVNPCTTFDGWTADHSQHRPEDQIPLDATYKTLCFESTDDRGGDRFWILQKRQSLNNVQSDGQSQPSPYWIMHIPTTIVKDHSTIFTFPLDRLLRGLLRFAGATGVVPASCDSLNVMRCDSLNPDAVQTVVREPIICSPSPPVKLAYEGLQSGCSSSGSSLCFRGETFRFHLEAADGAPYKAKECEAIQWDFADRTPVITGDSVEHDLPGNLKLAAVEIKSPAANQWIPLGVAPKFGPDSSAPTISYHGESSKCTVGGPACWQGEPIRFEVTDLTNVKATWRFDEDSKEGTPIEQTFTSIGLHEVHLGIVKDKRGGEATIIVPVESHCSPPGEEVAIQYRGAQSGCSIDSLACLRSEAISFSITKLPIGVDQDCFTAEWTFGDGATGSGLNTSHFYKASEQIIVSAKVTSAGVTVVPSTRLTLACPPQQPVALAYSGELSGCSRASVSNGTKFCTIGEPIDFSIPQESVIVGCSDIQWSFLTPDPNSPAIRVRHQFLQSVPSVSVQVRSGKTEATDAAPIRFQGPFAGDTPPPFERRLCPLLDRIAISYVGDRKCAKNKKCLPGESITFSIDTTDRAWSECNTDEIRWLFDDGTEQYGVTATKAFRRSKPPHSVHLLVLRDGKVATASTTVEVPLLKCNCSGVSSNP